MHTLINNDTILGYSKMCLAIECLLVRSMKITLTYRKTLLYFTKEM